MTIPLLIGQLRQAMEHLGRARAAIRTAVEEIGRAEAAIRSALGSSIADRTVYTAVAQARKLLGDADGEADRTVRAAQDWITKVEGGSSRGK